ncbi:PLP-dependent aspartate aminotransferase family protein [Chlorobaculum sp. MV4-Y]|uniref:trans-sulfuration enzyme family protein n=1 Tax=Chlorobaculum sp. MV4-Y TaxID=2976335 RepID=UPI0021AE98FB|nr:PLP-dependent aspartate aminotransferase family protein [Chlorobaculum sp. MV4-Y]UWX56974.1 PLP-dependent aspartate aminotransferase family protein [Chlorobaculum sp. MV4-Y]
MSFQTDTIHAGVAPDKAYGAIMTPIYQSSTFVFEDIGKHRGFDYTRSGNPTRKALEDSLAALEGCSGAVAVTTGMAAIATVMHLFAAGDEIICTDDCYGGTARLLSTFAEHFNVCVHFINLRNIEDIGGYVNEKTRAIWIETPSNPLLNLVDIAAVTAFAKERGLLSIVDNTFLSPYLQQPFKLGADVVVHSTTKYLNGHSDVVGGAILSNDPDLDQKLKFLVNALGTCAQPFDCWLVLRGIKTLVPRMKEHERNARIIAEFLDSHPKVKRVFYPGLESHPQHDLAKRQQRGFGGMVSFELEGGQAEVEQVLRGTRIFALAESLGGVESLIEHPATMSHASMGSEHRLVAGITDSVIRLSVGIEDPEDLVADLRQALA